MDKCNLGNHNLQIKIGDMISASYSPDPALWETFIIGAIEPCPLANLCLLVCVDCKNRVVVKERDTGIIEMLCPEKSIQIIIPDKTTINKCGEV